MGASKGFVIYQDTRWGGEFYTGKRYVHQGERFGVFSSQIVNAKVFRSKGVADRVIRTTFETFANATSKITPREVTINNDGTCGLTELMKEVGGVEEVLTIEIIEAMFDTVRKMEDATGCTSFLATINWTGNYVRVDMMT